jgi:hypothetical protein
MADNDVDLGRYAGVFSVYQTRIANSLAFEEALAHAAAFLSKVACLFDRDIEKPFFDEVEYLWATFPSYLKTLEKYQGLMQVLLGQAVDFYWYADWPRYRTAQDVKDDKNLYSFGRFRSDFDVAQAALSEAEQSPGQIHARAHDDPLQESHGGVHQSAF